MWGRAARCGKCDAEVRGRLQLHHVQRALSSSIRSLHDRPAESPHFTSEMIRNRQSASFARWYCPDLHRRCRCDCWNLRFHGTAEVPGRGFDRFGGRGRSIRPEHDPLAADHPLPSANTAPKPPAGNSPQSAADDRRRQNSSTMKSASAVDPTAISRRLRR